MPRRALLLSLFVTTAALAADFIAPDALDYRQVIPPPPAADSVAALGDYEAASLLDANRTSAQTALAKNYETYDVFKMLAPVLGDWATPQNLPRLAAVFRQATIESRPFTDAAKSAWNRPRPYAHNPSLNPVVERPFNASYPSGHAAGASIHAALLTELLPGHAAAWEQQAELVRRSRLYGGAHYPSDVMAGKLLGEAVAREMLKSPNLRKALDEVRAELAPFLRKKAA